MMGKASVSQPVRRWTKNEWIVLKSTINTHKKEKKSGLCAVECFSTQISLYNYSWFNINESSIHISCQVDVYGFANI